MKAAILGMGAMGQVHKQAYEAAGVEVVATYDPKDDGTDSKRREDSYGIVANTMENADIISICSTDDVHAAQVIQALDMGKHVFCEKPLCHTRREFEAIKAAYEPKKSKCVLGMNFPLRWHEPFVEAKARLPKLGEIYLVEADYEYGCRDKFDDGWRGEIEDYSLIMGGGVHMIDVTRWMTGMEMEGTEYLRIDVGEAVTSLAYLGNRCIFKLTCDFGGNKNHARRLRICGKKDSLYIDDREPTDKGRALREFLNQFYESDVLGKVVGVDEDVPSPEDIFRVHEIGLSL